MIWLIGIIVLIFLLLLTLYLIVCRRNYRRRFKSPLLPWNLSWIWGHIPEIKKKFVLNPNKSPMSLSFKYLDEFNCDMVVLFLFLRNTIICRDMEVIPKLMTDRKKFGKPHIQNDIYESADGVRFFGPHGLITDVGTDVWKTKRSIMDLLFTKSFLSDSVVGINEVGRNFVDKLRVRAETGLTFDVVKDVQRCVFNVIAVVGFNWTEDMLAENANAVVAMARTFTDIMDMKSKELKKFDIPYIESDDQPLIQQLINPIRDLLKEHLETVDGESSSQSRENVLSQIVRANKAVPHLTTEDMVDDYLVFMLSATGTVSSTVSCVLWFLSIYPEVYRKCKTEVDEIYKGKEELDYQDVTKLDYLEKVVKETMRLKPPIIHTGRQCAALGAKVGQHYFPGFTNFVIPISHLHNDSRNWENEKEFQPERFSPEAVKNIKPYSYMPFSAGQRNCIGKHFAMMEIKILISLIIKNFVIVNPVPGEKVLIMVENHTNRPKNGVNIKLISRQ